MNLKHSSACAGLLATGLLAWATIPAQAFNFTTGNNVGTCAALIDFDAEASYRAANGLGGLNPVQDVNKVGAASSCQTADGFSLQSGYLGQYTGKLQGKYIRDNTGGGAGYRVKGIGVNRNNDVYTTGGSADPVPGEISYGEFIDLGINGGAGGILASLDLGFLYGKGIFGDEVAETAVLTATDLQGNKITKKVTPINDVNNPGSETTNRSASVRSKNPDVSGGGWYTLFNPFGDLAVKNVRLEAFIDPNLKDANGNVITWNPNSDFSLVGATLKTSSASVPEPATITGLVLVGGALAATRRRRIASKVKA